MSSTAEQFRRALADDRLPLARMLELYQHDLSDIWDQDLDAHGEYGYALDAYWRDRHYHPFVAVVNGRYAGFALVNPDLKVGTPGEDSSAHWMAQFFVLKKYRRTGLGGLDRTGPTQGLSAGRGPSGTARRVGLRRHEHWRR